MGTSGHKIFQDDFALDIREMYLDKLFSGMTSENASNEMIAENVDADMDEMPIFWLSLAATQFEYGRLQGKVKEEAIKIIDTGVDLIRWNGDKKRSKELQSLKAKLLSVQPKEKKLINKKIKLSQGDVFIFNLEEHSYAYGRILNDKFLAIYLFQTANNKIPIEEIILKEIGFIVRFQEDGFYSRKWKVIGNLPLDDKLQRPVYFFDQGVGSTKCNVTSIWDTEYNPKVYEEKDCKNMDWGPFGIEQGSAYFSKDIIERLTAKLNNTPYNLYIQPDWEKQKFRKLRPDY